MRWPEAPSGDGMEGALRRAATALTDPAAAAAELRRGLDQDGLTLVVFFCAPRYANPAFAAAMAEAFAGVTVVGCTAAGEIGPRGYAHDSVSAVSFGAGQFNAVAGLLRGLREFRMAEATSMASALGERLMRAGHDLSERTFGFFLIDGLAAKEELIASCVGNALDGIPLFGGSAADDLRFERTWVYYDGAFHTDAFVLVLVETVHGFRVFRSQNFVAGAKKLVVTDADPATRIVREFNAAPAVEEYARLNELDPGALGPKAFATHPLVMKLGGAEYVRSVKQAHPDGSLGFYAKIEEGLVLTTADERDVLENLEGLFDELHHQLGEPLAVIGFDNILRRLHLEQSGTLARASALMRDNRVVGFNTFGEQFASMHVNQTFTGVAIGRDRR